MNYKSHIRLLLTLLIAFVISQPLAAQKKNEKPNILVIWGDDIGQSNISAYTRGMMGYQTPNIDRIADQGIMFTDHYAQPSCTAGRAAFITGQYPIRSGMTTVGQPGSLAAGPGTGASRRRPRDQRPSNHDFDRRPAARDGSFGLPSTPLPSGRIPSRT